MAIRHMHYTDIADTNRRSSAQRMLVQFRDAMRNPALSDAQRATLQAEIDRINAWVVGGLAVARPAVPKQEQ